jgi:uncharacterized membrane protein (UPF0127 family)
MKSFELRIGDGRVLCERCFVADSAVARMRGLLGRSGLESGEGLLLRPASSVHTFFMRFPIDVVFLGRDGEVLKVAERVPAWRTAAARGAKAVVELPAGEAARRALRVGDRLDPAGRAEPRSGPAANHPPASA